MTPAEIIAGILSKINNLPLGWDEFIGEELTNEVIDYMAAHSSDISWQYRKEDRDESC